MTINSILNTTVTHTPVYRASKSSTEVSRESKNSPTAVYISMEY